MAGNKETCHIAVTGKAGTGKSLAANYVSGLGFLLLDADKIGHAILEYPDVKNEIVRLMGSDIMQGGMIERCKLGETVFKYPEKLTLLNNIVWPKITGIIKNKLKEHKRTVTDAAVLPLWGIDELFDVILYLRSDTAQIFERLKKRGWNTDKIASVLKNQDWTKLPSSYIIINNDGTADELKTRIFEMLSSRGVI
ncbi:dephospho-CoA kinase [candidate division WOR-3 bacterium]|nr:dephospho-CoA kinase [candidate division WOR-3 bacterium]